MKVYFGSHNYYLGEQKTIKSLVEEKLVISTENELFSFGFEKNRVSSIPVYDMAGVTCEKILENKTINTFFYDSCFIENHALNTPRLNPDTLERSLMDHFMNYSAMNLCHDFGYKDVKFFGISQQGCSGLFACIEMATNMVRNLTEPWSALCLTAEKIPQNCYYDRPSQKLLHSDAASGLIVSNVQAEYQIIAYSSISNPKKNIKMLEILLIFGKITLSLLKEAEIESKEIENFFTPNFWIDFWNKLIDLIKGNKSGLLFDNISDSAHAFSSDFIINLKKREEQNMLSKGKYQIAYGYGFGSHFYCLLFKKI